MKAEVNPANKKNLKNGSTMLMISCGHYEDLLEIFDDLGKELTSFREDLLAHQSKVRRTLLDAGGAEK